MKDGHPEMPELLQLKIIPRADPAPWSCGRVKTPLGEVLRVSTKWSRADHVGQVRSRISAYRMKYSVSPGLYAVGEPDSSSPVLVSANYKLSFDILRRELSGLDVWLLVLDTKGINVWCAAGKGTFGTRELVHRILQSGLEKIVGHKKIVVPQLGAPGVDASAVQKSTGFRVYFGPVRARDVKAYLEAGYKATKDMRRIRFPIFDRLVLTPMELNPALKKFPLFTIIVLLIFGLQPDGVMFREAWTGGGPFLALGFATILSGAFFTPVMLPFIPFRSFAVKGLIMGFITVFMLMQAMGMNRLVNGPVFWVMYIFFPLASSYIALQFTGSTTYTGITGVKKELRFGLPLYIAGSAVSMFLVVFFKLKEWEVL